ncbi:MAG: hypothetical protein ACRCYU_05205, partial [Nocardioides sp.]
MASRARACARSAGFLIPGGPGGPSTDPDSRWTFWAGGTVGGLDEKLAARQNEAIERIGQRAMKISDATPSD